MIVTDDRVADFVGENCGVRIYPPFTCMGVERNGDVIGGVVFNCWTGPDIQVTVAGKGWSAEFLKQVGMYVFDRLRCARISIVTERENVVNIALRLGGKIEGISRDQFGEGRDGTMIGILKREYKFQ